MTYAQAKYWDKLSDESYTREQLVSEASEARILLTLTGHSGSSVGSKHPQPEICSTRGIFVVKLFAFPIITTGQSMRLKERHISPNARLYVDGHRVQGKISSESGSLIMLTKLLDCLSIGSLPKMLCIWFE